MADREPCAKRRCEMNERRQRFERVLDRLRTDRDELRVKAHLARAEAREEWEKLELRAPGDQ